MTVAEPAPQEQTAAPDLEPWAQGRPYTGSVDGMTDGPSSSLDGGFVRSGGSAHPAHPKSRAVVLGGGGPVGQAWQTGLVAGLKQHGIDLGDADLIIGTSAGAIVGAMLSLEIDLAAVAADFAAPDDESAPSPDAAAGLAALLEAAAAVADLPDRDEACARIGRMALAATTAEEKASLARAALAPLASRAWPRNLHATAVNVRTGTFTVWDATCPAPLLDAIAASSALPGVYPPITIGTQRYMDGGVRSMLNADLAAGHGTVIVVSCVALEVPGGGGDSDSADTAMAGLENSGSNKALLAELAAVRSSGSALEVVTPGQELHALTESGPRMFDPELIHDAYHAGLRQAEQLVKRLGAAWTRESAAAQQSS
jgi:NTE family protein